MNHSRKECTGGLPCAPASIPQALHCLIEHAPLEVAELSGALAAQYDLHVTRGYLYEMANPHRGDRGNRTLRVVSALTTITRRAVLLTFLCREAGGEFVQLPTVEAGADLADARVANETLRAQLHALETFTEGAADRMWTEREVLRFERAGREAVEAILSAIAYAKRRQMDTAARRFGDA